MVETDIIAGLAADKDAGEYARKAGVAVMIILCVRRIGGLCGQIYSDSGRGLTGAAFGVRW